MFLYIFNNKIENEKIFYKTYKLLYIFIYIQLD